MYWCYSFLDLCKILVDAELRLFYFFFYYVNCHLSKSDLSNMTLMNILYTRVILSMILVDFICFGTYFISEVSPIHTLLSSFIEPKNTPWETFKTRSLCNLRTDISSRYFCVFHIFPLTFAHIESDTFGYGFIWGNFYIQL